MTSTVVTDKAAPTRKVKYGSMSRDRTWALRWSYFFLVLFAIFFLLPPLYMLITSLKSSAEISAATNPWWVYSPTLSNYIELLTQNQYLTFFRNSAIVSVFVVVITMSISVIAAFIFTFTVAWAQFLYPLAFTTSTTELVLPVGIVTTLIKGDVFNWGQIMTGALLGAAPPLIIYAFLMDYYIAGLTAGATKG